MCIAKEAIVATCFAILLGVVIGSIIFFLHQNSPEDMDDDETTRLSTSTRILQEQDYIKSITTIKSTLNLALKDAVMAKSLLHYSSRNSSSSSSNNISIAEEFLIMVCKKQLRDSIDDDDLQRCNAKLDDVISSSSSPRWDLDDLRKWLTEAKMKQKTCLDAFYNNNNEEENRRKGEKMEKLLKQITIVEEMISKILLSSSSSQNRGGFTRRRLLSHTYSFSVRERKSR